MASLLAPSKRTALSARVDHRQDSETKRDAIKSEDAVAMPTHISHQNGNGPSSNASYLSLSDIDFVGSHLSTQVAQQVKHLEKNLYILSYNLDKTLL